MTHFEYITVADMRAEGVLLASYSDARVLECIRQASVKINLFTRQWFQPVVGIYYIDGDNTQFLSFTDFKKFIEVNSIEIISNRSSRIKRVVFPSNRYFDATTGIYQISQTGRVIEFVTDISILSSGNSVFDSGQEYVWPLGRQNIKVDGVFGWLDEKSISTTAAAPATTGDATVTVASTDDWAVGDYAVFYLDPSNDVVDIQIVTAVDDAGSKLLFEGDGVASGIRFDVSNGIDIKCFGRVPLLIQYVAKRFTIGFLELLSTVMSPSNIIANAMISEKVDNYTYKLNSSVLASMSGTDSLTMGGTGDSVADNILQNFVADVPVYINFV